MTVELKELESLLIPKADWEDKVPPRVLKHAKAKDRVGYHWENGWFVLRKEGGKDVLAYCEIKFRIGRKD